MKAMAIVLTAVFCLALPARGQDTAAVKKDAGGYRMPEPLTGNAFCKWMVGEWQGTGTSRLGKTKEWQKIEWALDNQFLLLHATSKITEMSSEQMDAAASAMKMSKEDIQKMKEMEYKGMGPLTVDPATGDFTGYWFDNWRGVYKGTGKLEGTKITMTWQGAMGSEVRTFEKLGEDKMVVTFAEHSPDGTTMEGRAEYARARSTHK